MPDAVVLFVIGLAATGSLAVWSVVLWRGSRRQAILPAVDTRPPAWSSVALCVTLGWSGIALVARLGLVDRVTEPPPVPTLSDVQQTCLISGVLLAVLLLILAHAGRRGLANFGIRRERWQTQLALGGLTFVASVLPVLAVLLATARWRTEDTQHPLLRLLAESDQTAVVAWVALAAVVLAPLVEELMYRVVLQGACERFLPASVAIVGVAIAFSAVHNPTDILPLVPFALLLGYVYHRTRSYLAVVTAHALFNLANLLLALAASGANGPIEPVPPGP